MKNKLLVIIKQFSLAIALVLLFSACQSKGKQIVISKSADEIEIYAARELQRYLYQLSGEFLEITISENVENINGFIIGQKKNNTIISTLANQGDIKLLDGNPGPQGYVLKRITDNGNNVIVIAGADAEGCLYGVYGLLDDHYDMGFYFSGDRFPKKTTSLVLVDVDEVKTPLTYIRGFLPWTNFPQAATSYSWEDWTNVIDQMARMRMNFIHIHNYSGEAGHNEMFANFEYEGKMSRVWMATARSGHRWSCPGWDVNKYRFGSSDLFDDYDFGADCALHNETLTNKEVFRKGVSEFQRVIAYAHLRGVRVGLGLDINHIPKEYENDPSNPQLVKARAEQIATDYPDLDFLLCFQSENIAKDEVARNKWRGIFDSFYDEIKQKSLPTRIAVSGWGLAAKDVTTLPEDVICAPIASYTAEFESGEIYGDREYWGCPWLEKDGDCSQYYYPYTINLSNTIKAWQNRAPNMQGLYSLTWRNTDAIDPKLSYISKVAWYADDRYTTSEKVYNEYAEDNYGKEAAAVLTGIINENEPWVDSQGECRPTLAFSTEAKKGRAHICNVDYFQFMSKEHITPQIKAVDFSAKNGSARKKVLKDNTSYISNINSADWLSYENIDFGSGVNQIKYRISSLMFYARFELRLDSLQGTLLQNCEFDRTFSWNNWKEYTTSIKEVYGRHTVYMIFHPAPETNKELLKAKRQIALIDSCIKTSKSALQVARLNMLRCRIEATSDHIKLNNEFENYQWNDLPGVMNSWMRNFNERISDISSLGNIISVQNRYVSQNYQEKEEALLATLSPKPVVITDTRGTDKGAIVTWEYDHDNVSGYYIYRDKKRMTKKPLSPDSKQWEDNVDGTYNYAVSVIDNDGKESLLSTSVPCEAGSADATAPKIVIVSPPTSIMAGQAAWIKVRLLDGRNYESVQASIYYRTIGDDTWLKKAMIRRIKSVFAVALQPQEISEKGIEYYIEATDGTNISMMPTMGCLSFTCYSAPSNKQPLPPTNLKIQGSKLTWDNSGTNHQFCYRIYRGQESDFQIGPASYLTFVEKGTKSFCDNGYGLNGSRMKGKWYYRITAMAKNGIESNATESVELNAEQLIQDIENKIIKFVPNESFGAEPRRKVQ